MTTPSPSSHINRQKLALLKKEFRKLQAHVADEEGMLRVLDAEHADLSGQLVGLEGQLASLKAETEVVEASVRAIDQRLSADPNDPNLPGLSENEVRLREERANVRRLKEVRLAKSTELHEIAAQNKALRETHRQLKDLVEQLTNQSKELYEIIEENTHEAREGMRSRAQRREDERHQQAFQLPDGEVVLATYSCVHKLLPGRITVSPNYVCFVNDLGADRIKIHIKSIKRLRNTRFVGLFNSCLEITHEDGAETFSHLFRRRALVDNILKAAASLGHPIPLSE
jgi:hypothetical protein